MEGWRDLFAFRLRLSGDEFSFFVGYFWLIAIAALIWWAI